MILINYRDSRPIYEQIKDGLKKQMISGIMASDSKLPSVRDLASELAINPNTIQRAYRELEAEGYIYSVPGKGSFACASPEIDLKAKAEYFNKFEELISHMKDAGITYEEIEGKLSEYYGRKL